MVCLFPFALQILVVKITQKVAFDINKMGLTLIFLRIGFGAHFKVFLGYCILGFVYSQLLAFLYQLELLKTNMRKIIVIGISACLSITYSCGDSAKKGKDAGVNGLQTKTTMPEESNSIELNNGAKWKVVDEMMVYIKNMESEVKRFSETNHEDIKDFSLLAVNLQKNITLLTSNCTMQGKAHDELHKWLLPYIDLVDELNKSKNTKEAQDIFNEIESSFKVVDTYFER